MRIASTFLSITLVLTLFSLDVQAQEEITVVVEPTELTLSVGQEVQLRGHALNAAGERMDTELRFISSSRRDLQVSRAGLVRATTPGSFTVRAVYSDEDRNRTIKEIPVSVEYPPLKEIVLKNVPDKMYTDNFLDIDAAVYDEAGLERKDVELHYETGNHRASVDRFGTLKALETGNTTITVSAEGVEVTNQIRIERNPVSRIEIGNETDEFRTGDVIRINAKALNQRGSEVQDAPIHYSFIARPDDQLGQPATAQVEQDGRFVANKPGHYTLIAKSGNVTAEQTVRVEPRNVEKEWEVIGHGQVFDVHTSDLWVWEGVDGRDYAVTGTWGANGEAYFWDVTDPANMTIVDTVRVDARTVNDVKCNEAGTICVLTREGASDRRNGIVLVDVTDPHNVEILAEYTDGLTGGVHNAFIYEDHVYAVNNGRRYDIINIEDPRNPYQVSRFELDNPGRAIHDVWVEDGIAYSSNWGDGVIAVDVGSNPNAETPEGHEIGLGSPSNPVKLGQYAYPSGWNHAAFPFKSESTGDFYIIAGDEAFPNGLHVRDRPTVPAGWIHFIKFDGWDNPDEVARYQIPEAGTHNFWVVGDTLYVAYYNAGLRAVDISGELMGNLYDQGREIAWFIPTHHEGFVPNAAMTWSPHPHKGYIFISDWNSGIWALKLKD